MYKTDSFISADEIKEIVGISKSKAYSLISLLIDMGFSAVAIGNRVGHESEKITYRYAHLFPSVQGEMAEALDDEWKEGFNVGKEEG